VPIHNHDHAWPNLAGRCCAGLAAKPWLFPVSGHPVPDGPGTGTDYYARSMDGAQETDRGPARHWRAPVAGGPVRAALRLPGSKSMTNRALVLAALADGPGIIANPLRARDTLLMARALTALGASVEDSPAGWRVTPGTATGDARVDVGNAGTVMRFVPPVAALTRAAAEFHGDARAAQRPIGPIIDGLREIGAVIDDGGRSAIPFTVHGTGSLAGGVVTVDASASSQMVSGLLLAAPRYDKGVEVRHRGPRAPSAPHIAMTVQMLRDAGAEVEAGTQHLAVGSPCDGELPDTWVVRPGVIGSSTISVQPDLVNAAPFLAAALVTGGTVTILDWPATTSQPARQILDMFARLGAAWERTPGGLAVTGTGVIHGITADLSDVSEISPVLTALAALADSPSVLTGIGHQRLQETDRLAALAHEINALGGEVTELADGLEIRPRPLRASGVFASYDDHRLVMAAAVLGLAVPGIEVANAATVGKTFPEFTGLWAAMLEAPESAP
jgi:3-phosphoshikimate 1-carboxyvinyltransferase